jgi:hypothetical protein
MPVMPNLVFSNTNVKARWEERYTSEAINQKFLGLPRGVYSGFIPQTTPGSLVLTLGVDPVDGVGLIRAESGTGASAVMVDILVSSPVTLDFTGNAVWPLYVIATANYQVGMPTTAQLLTRTTPAATPAEVNVCLVNRPGNTGDLIITPSEVFPTNDITARQEPYAFNGSNPQKFGFMPEGSYESLLSAEATTEEVVAARQFIGGGVAPTFDPLNPQITGLPDRLNTDLSGPSMATRLGLRNIVTPSNSNYTIPSTVIVIPIAAAVFNPGDFVTTTAGISNNGIVLSLNSSAASTPNVVVDVAYGTFSSGTLSKFPTGATTAISGSVVTFAPYINVSGSFSAKRRAVESPPNYPAADTSATLVVPAGTLALISPGGSEASQGAITSNSGGAVGVTADTVRNTCQINRLDSGQRLVDPTNGAVVYGRLDFATGAGAITSQFPNYYSPILPASLSATFVNASPTVVLNVNPVGIVSVGDIIQVSVSTITLTLASATGFNNGDSVNNGLGATGIIRSISGSIITVVIAGGTWAVTTGTITDSTTTNTTTYSSATITATGDGRFYEVISMDGSPKLTLNPAYAGSTTTVTGNLITRNRYNLNFVENAGSGEVATSFTSSPSIPLRFFFPTWFSLQNSDFDASLLMKIPGDPVNDATTTAKGRTLLAPNNSGGANTANDTKAGMIVNIQASGATVSGVTGNYHTLNFQTLSSNITAGPPGVVNIAATGGVGPPGLTGPTGATGGLGPPGPTGSGYSNFGFMQQTVSSIPAGSQTGSVTFTFSSFPGNVKMAAAGCMGISELTQSIPFWITNITGPQSSQTVTVTWQSNCSGFSFDGQIWCSAAG